MLAISPTAHHDHESMVASEATVLVNTNERISETRQNDADYHAKKKTDHDERNAIQSDGISSNECIAVEHVSIVSESNIAIGRTVDTNMND